MLGNVNGVNATQLDTQKWLKGKFCVNVESLLLTYRVNP